MIGMSESISGELLCGVVKQIYKKRSNRKFEQPKAHPYFRYRISQESEEGITFSMLERLCKRQRKLRSHI